MATVVPDRPIPARMRVASALEEFGLTLDDLDIVMAQIGPLDLSRPFVRLPSGELATEQGITVEDRRLNDGSPTVIPSIVDGAIADTETAIRAALRSGEFSSGFSNIEQANRFSRIRSSLINALRQPRR